MCVLNVHKRMVQIPFQFLTLETVNDRLQYHRSMSFLFWPKGVNRQTYDSFYLKIMLYKNYYGINSWDYFMDTCVCVCVCLCYMCVCVYMWLYIYVCVCVCVCVCGHI